MKIAKCYLQYYKHHLCNNKLNIQFGNTVKYLTINTINAISIRN